MAAISFPRPAFSAAARAQEFAGGALGVLCQQIGYFGFHRVVAIAVQGQISQMMLQDAGEFLFQRRVGKAHAGGQAVVRADVYVVAHGLAAGVFAPVGILLGVVRVMHLAIRFALPLLCSLGLIRFVLRVILYLPRTGSP